MEQGNAPFAWQHSQWQQLQTQVQAHQLPHALLLVGEQGLGKALFAQRFAQGLLCQSPNAGQMCGMCKPCQLLAAQTHPDYCVLTGSGKSETISIDSIRSLADFCEQTPQCGDKKIILIAHADKMNVSASNALLKMLEEPPGNTYFMLTTHTSIALPATLRSRCQVIRFSMPAQGEGLIATPEWQTAFHLDCAALMSMKLDPLSMAQKWQKEEPLLILDQFYGYFAQKAREQLAGTAFNLFSCLDKIIKTRKLILQHNSVNTPLQLEALFISLTQTS